MGWAVGDDGRRDVGYGVPATCDYPGCGARINRGLSYVCGGQPYGGSNGCGLFFCEEHRSFSNDDSIEGMLCDRCLNPDASGNVTPFEPTPDVPEWINHKLTDESWAEWRSENPDWVAEHQPRDIPEAGLTEVTIIGENDHGYRFGVGRRGAAWAAFAIGKTGDDDFMVWFFPDLPDRYANDRATAIKLAGAFPQDPESAYGGVGRWFVAEELRGKPENFRCSDCGSQAYWCDCL